VISSRYEYLFLLLIFSLVGASIISPPKWRLARRRPYVLSLVGFFVFGTVVDWLAVRWNWWTWSAVRCWGPRALEIPVEEFILFVIFHAVVVLIWETTGDYMA
jgi:lycopene cyclase domain-containing protein